uniref:type IX secretion system periplasmic lipoprotein PorW/SprE n=1 Tax=Daejeonella rubra TaxID=990371 RepID=UPI000B8040CD|nr:tetratricopeptide repeat protein [Daejeonella rubra]
MASRGMQNLTAHYNILYNAKELINESERNIQLAYSDDYDRVIPVYKEPNETISQSELKKLDDAILKANTIANQKSLSKYVDNAYFLIGKANHLKSNFYNAVEFFSYVYVNYPKEKEIRQASLAWKTRSLIASDRLEEAEASIDSALRYISSEKKSVADIYAIRAQLHIYAKEDAQAISLLEKAIKSAVNKQNKIRWTYLIAQLQEINEQPKDAYLNYTRVLKSNAPFDMAFNAKLSMINLKNQLSGDTSGRTRQIAAMLKDDKNRDFTDQIYFQIADSYADASNIDKAIENYNYAISKSTKNVTQKGLAYLKLAEIYFKQTDYIKSKAYYDSTLISLPTIYPDYALIKKKADNLELLADRLSIIAREDTLQMLAALPESERNNKVSSLIKLEALKAQARKTNSQSGGASTIQISSTGGDNKFYFNNSIALNQGLADFKKRWGTRKLEDNWRRSQKSASDISNGVSPFQTLDKDPFQQLTIAETEANLDSLKKSFTESIPLSSEMKLISDQKIASAMYDIANYYREVSADTAEAVKTYEQLLKRFPENSNKLAVYYNLYRLYRFVNPKRSDEYKNILLNQYPQSPFAKIILDPEYSQKTDEQELAFNRFYNEVYNLYTSRNYPEVLKLIEQQKIQAGEKKLSVQLAYIGSLALGHLQKLDQLESAFKNIVDSNPDDQLIVPLVKLHLAYIDSNRTTMSNRVFALLDNDSKDNTFIEEPVFEQVIVAKQNNEQRIEPTITITPAGQEQVPISELKKEEIKSETPAAAEFFDLEESTDHYFVVNVSDPSVNLSSSRFGIGQFNRVNLPGTVIKHQLKSIANQNQLIFVGPLTGKEAAKTYFNQINPLIREIMKIPANKYSTFYINKQNLEKISDRETLDRYVEFYKRNY